MNLLKYLILLIISTSFCISQENEETQLENLLEIQSRNTNSSSILDDIDKLSQNRIKLVNATENDLLKIPLLTSDIVTGIIKLVNQNNRIRIKDIRDSLNLSEDQYYLLLLCTEAGAFEDKAENEFRSKFLYKNQFNKLYGYEKNKFIGDRLDLTQKYLLKARNYELCAVLDKNLGEKSITDYYSIALQAEYDKTKITIGNFNIQSGLGSLLWQSNSSGKSYNTVSPAFQYSNNTDSYYSTTDFGYFRGIAIQSSLRLSNSNSINFQVWSAYTQKSGTYDSTSNSITSVYTTGNFTTQSELSKKNTFQEINAGGTIEYVGSDFRIGTTNFIINNSKELATTSAVQFSGRKGLLSSIFSMFNIGNISFAAEAAKDANGNMAYKLNSLYKKPIYNLVFNFRAFSPQFRSPYGYMFGENSNPNNEIGLYSGIEYKYSSNLRIAGFIDVFKSYQSTYYVPVPIYGVNALTYIDYKFDNYQNIIFSGEIKNKTDAITINSKTKEKSIFQKNNFSSKIEWNYQITKNFKSKVRCDVTYVDFKGVKEKEMGFACYTELKWIPIEKFNIGGRFSYFSTKSYESAIWQFESAIQGYMYTPPLYGNGFRTYAYSNFKISDVLEFWLKFEYTNKYNVSTLGSSYTEILDNKDLRFYLQVQINM